jgi:hypothetical protein
MRLPHIDKMEFLPCIQPLLHLRWRDLKVHKHRLTKGGTGFSLWVG